MLKLLNGKSHREKICCHNYFKLLSLLKTVLCVCVCLSAVITCRPDFLLPFCSIFVAKFTFLSQFHSHSFDLKSV